MIALFGSRCLAGKGVYFSVLNLTCMFAVMLAFTAFQSFLWGEKIAQTQEHVVEQAW